MGPAPEGRFGEEPPPRAGRLVAFTARSNEAAAGRLTRYARTHWRWQSGRLYGRVLKDMEI